MTGLTTMQTLTLGLALGLASGCSRTAPNPAPTRAPAPAVAATVPPPSASIALPVASPQAVFTLPGDEQLPEPWRARFRAWLSAEVNPRYVRVIDSHVMSNAVSVVLERRTQENGVCLTGPSRLDLVQDEGATQANAELQHFGNDCCPGSECLRTADGWNLRFLALLAAQDWQQLSLLAPAQQKLVWTINGGELPTVKLTRKDVAAGRFRQAPNCGFMYNVPSCDELAAGSNGFTCRCDGGGYHVSYAWEREGTGFVLVSVNEDSH
jgi:hypothetical protein